MIEKYFERLERETGIRKPDLRKQFKKFGGDIEKLSRYIQIINRRKLINEFREYLDFFNSSYY